MSEAWRIEVSSRTQRDLRRLPSKVVTAVVEFVTGALAENPARLSKPLHNAFAGYRSARRGDYRVLRIDEVAGAVLVVRIDHRSHVYRAPLTSDLKAARARAVPAGLEVSRSGLESEGRVAR